MSLNLKDIYKPIGRLYEEIPSANYAGDYLAANGDWNNATDDDTAVQAIRDSIASLEKQRDAYKAELTKLISGTSDCTYQPAIYLTGQDRGYQCKSLEVQYGTRKNTKGDFKNWTFVEYDLFQKLGARIKTILPNAIAELDSQIKIKQSELDLQISLKKKSTEASQETKSKTLDIDKARIEAEAKKKVEESKQKQTEAELRAKKIFLAIIASGVILSAAGYALFRR